MTGSQQWYCRPSTYLCCCIVADIRHCFAYTRPRPRIDCCFWDQCRSLRGQRSRYSEWDKMNCVVHFTWASVNSTNQGLMGEHQLLDVWVSIKNLTDSARALPLTAKLVTELLAATVGRTTQVRNCTHRRRVQYRIDSEVLWMRRWTIGKFGLFISANSDGKLNFVLWYIATKDTNFA